MDPCAGILAASKLAPERAGASGAGRWGIARAWWGRDLRSRAKISTSIARKIAAARRGRAWPRGLRRCNVRHHACDRDPHRCGAVLHARRAALHRCSSTLQRYKVPLHRCRAALHRCKVRRQQVTRTLRSRPIVLHAALAAGDAMIPGREQAARYRPAPRGKVEARRHFC